MLITRKSQTQQFTQAFVQLVFRLSLHTAEIQVSLHILLLLDLQFLFILLFWEFVFLVIPFQNSVAAVGLSSIFKNLKHLASTASQSLGFQNVPSPQGIVEGDESVQNSSKTPFQGSLRSSVWVISPLLPFNLLLAFHPIWGIFSPRPFSSSPQINL